MESLSVRGIATECLRKSGSLSLKEDIISVRQTSPPQSLRGELEYILEFRCSPSDPTPPSDPTLPRDFSLPLERQLIDQGFPPFTNQFPIAGIGSGRITKIFIPPQQLGIGIDFALLFAKVSNPSETVPINADESSTPEEMTQIFGVSEPRFNALQRIPFVAYLAQNSNNPFPDKVNIIITVIND